MRYFFDVFMDGNRFPDPEGTELPTDETAQAEAFQCATELEREFPRKGLAARGSIVEVTDESGRRIIALPIHRHQSDLESVS